MTIIVRQRTLLIQHYVFYLSLVPGQPGGFFIHLQSFRKLTPQILHLASVHTDEEILTAKTNKSAVELVFTEAFISETKSNSY